MTVVFERNYFFQSKDVGKIALLAQLAARQSHNQTRFFFYQSHATSRKIAYIGYLKMNAPCEDRTHDLQISIKIMRLTRCLHNI